MRLWSLHPKHLDSKGLVALWREGLLARKVLSGETHGYTRHPQLKRFWAAQDPRASIDAYLHAVCDEADLRGYHFNRAKLGPRAVVTQLQVTKRQLAHEHEHLRKKLERRSPEDLHRLENLQAHPLFKTADGPVADWERA